MYRIRLVSGQERLYRSIQELTAGVQRGEVTAGAEIYHQRTERWLSVESHPHYRMAVEGGTVTRTSRLKFTRPSSPIPTSGVRPTPPAAQRPGEGDIEELNRLLLLLDPLPTPSQRAAPEPPSVQSPPDLSLVRPDPIPASMMSDDSQPTFGTILRLEDLEPAPTRAEDAPLDVIRDERILHEDEEVEQEAKTPVETASLEPTTAFAAEGVTDLGLPIEIHLDEIPVPTANRSDDVSLAVEPQHLEWREEIMPAVEATLLPTPAVGELMVESLSGNSEPTITENPLPPGPTPRRIRPMLYVAAAAIAALAVFAFTGTGDDRSQSMVTLASATPPSDVAAPLTVAASLPVAAGQTSGFPLPTAGSTGKPLPNDPRFATPGGTAPDSGPSPALLPSAPTIDLTSSGTEMVETRAAEARVGAGNGLALARNYSRTYGDLSTEFSAQMDRSGLVRLFSQTQLTTSDGLSGARRALDAATAAVRQYHAKEATIERAYQDSARALERGGATAAELRDWMTHPSLRESQEAAAESARLLGQIDAVFALLQSQAGRYRIEGSAIRFQDTDAAARYTDLQNWITRRLEHWSGQPASSVPATVQPLLAGIGLTRLPTSR
jgi:hypothetical protein